MAGQQAKQNKDYSDVANGPIAEGQRQCRDVFCCLLFMINLIAMGYCAIQGYANGNTSKIWRATDSAGVVCGGDGAGKDYPFSYFYQPLSGTSKRVCVAACPAYVSGAIADPTFLDDGTLGASPTWTTIAEDGSLASPLPTMNLKYNSMSVMGRICIPETKVFNQALSAFKDAFYSASNSGTFSNFITDIMNNWQWILAAFGFAIVVSFIFMYALKCLAGCIVWLSIFGIIGFVTGMGVIFLYNAGKFAAYNSYVGYLGIPTYAANSNYDIYGYICFGIAAVLLIVLLCCCSRIRLAVAVCKAAGQFVASVCLIVLVPIWQTFLVACLWAPALLAIIFLASSATFTHISGDVFTSIANYADQKLIYLYYFVFGTLWSNAILQAMGIFVIASACSMWYYSHGPGQQLDSPILRSYKMIFRYHFGSLAFGSLILAIVQFLQLVVEAFKKQAENAGADKNPCFEYVINCIRCCLACVQRIVQFINKTAYIQIAIRGKSFCNAAFDGFEIVWSNAMRYTIVSGVGQILMFIGKLMISASTTLAFYCLVTFVSSIKQTILEPILMLIIVFIIAYAVSTLFMAVYSISMDTLLACFIIDQTNQKAKGGKAPLYAPQELAELIDRD